MKYRDSVTRARRSLLSARGRTILTALAIAVGAFTLTLAIAAGTGARQYADALISSNVDPQALYAAKDGQMFGEGGGQPGGGLREYSEDTVRLGRASLPTLTQDDVDEIAELDSVASVTPAYMVSAQYVTFEGIDQRYVSDITAYNQNIRSDTAAGDMPELGQQLEAGEIIMPETYAEVLDIDPAELIGREVTLNLVKTGAQPSDDEIQTALLSGGPAAVENLLEVEGRQEVFTIRAISAQSSTTLLASAGLFIGNESARELSEFLTADTEQFQRYVAANIIAEQDADTAEVRQQIEDLGFAARTAEDLQELLFTFVNVLQGIVAGFGVLALIASVFGIINTQYISVLERTREIGLMKALGMRGRHVSRMFQLEAAWIGLLGGIIGALLGWGVGTAINPRLTELMRLGEYSILVFELLPIIALIIALVLIAMLAGWFPARKAAKLDPIEALRTE